MEEENQIINTLTWDNIREARNIMLFEAEKMYNFDSPDELKKAWQDYKQELRDIPEKFKNLEDLNQIVWPEQPTAYIQRLELSRLGFH